jgi:hypothetical protein
VHDEVVQDETGTIQKHLKRIHPSHEIARRYGLQVRGVFPGVEYINPGKISIVDFDDVTCVADGRMCEQQICVIDRNTVDLEGLEGALETYKGKVCIDFVWSVPEELIHRDNLEVSSHGPSALTVVANNFPFNACIRRDWHGDFPLEVSRARSPKLTTRGIKREPS